MNAARAELKKVEPTMVELRERRRALEQQTERMREATRALEQHRMQGQGAWRR